MDTKFLNSILKACDEVLLQVLGLKGQRGRLHWKSGPFLPEDILLFFHVQGDVATPVALSLEQRLGIDLASQLLGSMSVTSLTDLARSALGELGNMIMGRAMTLLAEEGTLATISVPQVLTGLELQADPCLLEDKPCLVVPFEFGRGRIEINVPVG
ncbi:MAG: chemotaxis protein CheX [Bacillota bacterium]|nr:chemotaxis protein CheX [Bacillota bacterium]